MASFNLASPSFNLPLSQRDLPWFFNALILSKLPSDHLYCFFPYSLSDSFQIDF
jgi:hypothetical protein